MRTKYLRWVALVLITVACVPIANAASISWGSSGSDVRQVQQKLKQWGYYNGTVDGVYGQGTHDAVVRFQRRNGLKADGVVGEGTAAAIGISVGAGSGSQSAQAQKGTGEGDVNLLARLVHGEARGESHKGQVAVAAVVLNRVRHPSFPNTIAGVIYQPGAFDAVADGQIYLEPAEGSIRAAKDAMNGWDPTGGCLYYYNPTTATAAWIWSREIRTIIGRHNFAV